MKIQQIDDVSLERHHYLRQTDLCYYFGVYTPTKSYQYSDMNQLIYNLKITPAEKHRQKHRRNAILTVAEWLVASLTLQSEHPITFAPVPSSKGSSHPEYNPRTLEILQLYNRLLGDDFHLNIRDIIQPIEDKEASHLTSSTRSPDQLQSNYQLDDTLKNPIPEKVIIFDDLITSGAHFRVIHDMLKKVWPDCQIYGLFVASAHPETTKFY